MTKEIKIQIEDEVTFINIEYQKDTTGNIVLLSEVPANLKTLIIKTIEKDD